MFIFDISPTASVLVLIIFMLWFAYQLKDKYPLGCSVVFIAFMVFTIKTCRELDEEEAAEKAQMEQFYRQLEQEKLQRELRMQSAKEAEEFGDN